MIEMFKTIQASDMTYRMGWALVHSLWLGAGIAAALALVLAVLQRRRALVRYAATCGGLGIMVAGMGWAFWMIPPRGEQPQVQAKIQIEEGSAAALRAEPRAKGNMPGGPV